MRLLAQQAIHVGQPGAQRDEPESVEPGNDEDRDPLEMVLMQHMVKFFRSPEKLKTLFETGCFTDTVTSEPLLSMYQGMLGDESEYGMMAPEQAPPESVVVCRPRGDKDLKLVRCVLYSSASLRICPGGNGASAGTESLCLLRFSSTCIAVVRRQW